MRDFSALLVPSPLSLASPPSVDESTPKGVASFQIPGCFLSLDYDSVLECIENNHINIFKDDPTNKDLQRIAAPLKETLVSSHHHHHLNNHHSLLSSLKTFIPFKKHSFKKSSNNFISHTSESIRAELLLKEKQPKRGRGRPRKQSSGCVLSESSLVNKISKKLHSRRNSSKRK
ncbi:hypothetical protein FDP41_002022 [Naegleria fowleri]|uniref:Uncharacterized protein n=1 Tax=Naegleria fowleri TaxID=5763 RepID=A0A6A5BWE2_NAEFO|nr:uncharacterized protein FDP41_002022 [Naegleria fowleri]KAF0978952.1 hypothetical protein FDP41_002022 [Naegleria fowleri]